MSLLPAPQQAMLSMDEEDAFVALYGPRDGEADVSEGNEPREEEDDDESEEEEESEDEESDDDE